MSSAPLIHNHMPTDWKAMQQQPGMRAADAPLPDKAAIVCHVGIIALAGGTGSWRVREAMNNIARLLGITVHVDVSLLGIECSCTQGNERFTQVVTLKTTDVNTHRIWKLESFVQEAVENGSDWTVAEFHKRLEEIENLKGNYSPAQLGLASGFACGAFVFLLGGGPYEMLCAAIGAGFGNFVRAKMLGKQITQMFAVAVSVSVACLLYLLSINALELFLGISPQNEAGYIGAMLFVIPGFPLVTSGLDIAKLDMRSGFERLGYALTVIGVATLVGWIVAVTVGLQPGQLVAPDFSPLVLCLLRLAMSFVGVFGFSIMFNSPVKMAATAGVVGAVGNTFRLELTSLTSISPALAAFLGALTAGLLAYAVIANHKRIGLPRWPRISITVPSIVIMVPGLYMYRAVYDLAANSVVDSMSWAFQAAIIIVFLPIGLALARILTDKRWRYCI